MHLCLVCGVSFEKVHKRVRCAECHALFRKEYYKKNRVFN